MNCSTAKYINNFLNNKKYFWAYARAETLMTSWGVFCIRSGVSMGTRTDSVIFILWLCWVFKYDNGNARSLQPKDEPD